MTAHQTPTPPETDGIHITDTARGRTSTWMLAATAVAVVGGLALWRLSTPDAAAVAGDAPPRAPATTEAGMRTGYAATAMAAVGKARPLPGDDRNDIAAYFHPGDPEPTGAELITALNEAGVHTGIAAFNPPGTSPPLTGLVVPDDFPLPEGYVRHYQATDDGQRIDPILMYSPDFEFLDANGNPIAIPRNRVVPPHLAPRGLPLRTVRFPPPLTQGGRS